MWSFNGAAHRKNGPAIQEWFKTGRIKYEGWFINGKELSNTELKKYKKWLKEYNLLNKTIWTDEEMVLWVLTWQ